ncbi:MAG: hypothetical protein IIX61_02270 [Loktanella sp.]|nr:hypothetical protein [Loktanella sp.]
MMTNFLTRDHKKIKQYQRLNLISKEAKRIRELHEAGDISALDAAKMLMELRERPEAVLMKHGHDAA